MTARNSPASSAADWVQAQEKGRGVLLDCA